MRVWSAKMNGAITARLYKQTGQKGPTRPTPEWSTGSLRPTRRAQPRASTKPERTKKVVTAREHLLRMNLYRHGAQGQRGGLREPGRGR